MRTPVTSRQCAYKLFYVFFGFGGKRSNCYTVLNAQSLEKAKMLAYMQFGVHDVKNVIKDKNEAESRIKAFNLKRI